MRRGGLRRISPSCRPPSPLVRLAPLREAVSVKMLAEYLDTAIKVRANGRCRKRPNPKGGLRKTSCRLSQARGKKSQGIRAQHAIQTAVSKPKCREIAKLGVSH